MYCVTLTILYLYIIIWIWEILFQSHFKIMLCLRLVWVQKYMLCFGEKEQIYYRYLYIYVGLHFNVLAVNILCMKRNYRLDVKIFFISLNKSTLFWCAEIRFAWGKWRKKDLILESHPHIETHFVEVKWQRSSV